MIKEPSSINYLKSLIVFFVLALCLNAKAQASDGQLKQVLAINADADYGEYLASECTTCHSIDKPDSNIPPIHGKKAAYLAEALLEYKNNTRENATMRSVAGALGLEEIAALVEYLSKQ